MRTRLVAATYSLAVFLSAALLFTAQLSFAKALLPLLGGTPAVWNTAMLFYQSVLLAGYAYAHGVTRLLSPRWQVRFHVALLLISILTIPAAGLPDRTPPATGSPVFWLIGLLVVTLGPTLFLLSATSPLIQAWFRRSGHERAADPYFLYAPSNLGSMLAVLGYPFLIEPVITLRQQHRAWAAGYLVLAAVIAACGALVWRSREPVRAPSPEPEPEGTAEPIARAIPNPGSEPISPDEPIPDAGPAPAEERPGVGDRVWWLVLTMVPSSLVLGVTTYLSTDVAAFPLLWVAPLSLYLLSFVLTFARRPPIPMFVSWWGQLVVIGLWVALYFARVPAPVWARFTLHLLVLFFTAMICHGELVRRRPAARYLTQFYLLLALGGAMGAAFNALLAPLVFREVVEYPLAIMVACLLRPAFTWPRTSRVQFAVEALVALVLATLAALIVFRPELAHRVIEASTLPLAVLIALSVIAVGRRSPLRFALLITLVWVAATQSRRYGGNILLRERSFFGVYEVRETPLATQRTLVHGTTLHGGQWVEPANRRRLPTSYYTPLGPLGHLFESQGGFADTARIGAVGLGAGTVACYAQPDQRWTFFELDPLVERIARDTAYFTFLSDCTPTVRVVLGDARVSLRSEPDAEYDLFIMDAFSSDAVPVHLLTREALQLYVRKLKPSGLIAFHISNRYVDIEPVLAALAEEAGLMARYQIWRPDAPDASAWLLHPSRWLVVGRDSASFGRLLTDERWEPPETRAGVAPWTDEFSSVPSVMIWRSKFAG